VDLEFRREQGCNYAFVSHCTICNYYINDYII
jgi:uncharacterized Fe-S cluster-containing MiaB family protein